MANKAVFIGLGGAGVQATGHLKARLLRAAPDRAALGADARFVFIDTSDEDVKKLNSLYRGEFGGNPLIGVAEQVDLGDVNPYAIVAGASEDLRDGRATDRQRRLLSWIDPKGVRELRNQPLSNGASANRQQGRVAVWQRMRDIQVKIADVLGILQNMSREDFDRDSPSFYLLSGTCGGTGSSAFLDVAYILDREFKRQHPDWGNPCLRAVLFMPHWYIEHHRAMRVRDSTVDRYMANAHAFFDEINFFLEDYHNAEAITRGRTFSAIAVDPAVDRDITGSNLAWPVLNFGILVDSTTELGSTLDEDQLYSSTAEMLFHWHLGNAQGSVIASFDNTIAANFNGESPVPAFVTMGYRALEFPADAMREYFERRFLYELFSTGLLGKRLEEAIPDEDARRRELEGAFRGTVCRYLFADDAVDGVPNLERSARDIRERYLQGLTPGRFLKQEPGVFDKVRGFIGGQRSADDYDVDRIRDSVELASLKSMVDVIARNLATELRSVFEADDQPAGRIRLLRAMQLGTSVVESGARAGSLERVLEDAILRFGLVAARQVADRLDVHAASEVQVLAERQRGCRERLSAVEARVAMLEAACLDDRKSAATDNFTRLFAAHQERIGLVAEETILGQQIALLNALSEGESGILDAYEDAIARMADACRLRLEGGRRDSRGTVSLEKAYCDVLPKSFRDTTSNVTTIYLPAIADFVGIDSWAEGNDFARLYETLVEQAFAPGGLREPRRHGEELGRHPDVKGLHDAMRRMLTSEVVTGLARGHERDGEIAFFREYFDAGGQDPQRMVNLLEGYGSRYIAAIADESSEVRTEMERPLIERLEGLRHDDLLHLKDRFSDEHTQTFCAMTSNRGEERPIYSVYVGHNESLAAHLGYEPTGAMQQFVFAETPTRLLKIKVRPLFSSESYPHADSYRQVYLSARKQDGEPCITPHLHRLFNEHGVAIGARLLAEPSPVELRALLVKSLLYKELFEAASSTPDLLAEVVFVDASYRGERETFASPMRVEGTAAADRRIVACERLDFRDGRMVFERVTFVNIAGSVRTHRDILDGLAAHPHVRDVLARVDSVFRERSSRAWLAALDAATELLAGKLTAKTDDTADLRDFYDQLHNILVDVSRELRAIVAAKSESRQIVTSSDIVPDREI